ncbi:MAG: hypothetical protein PHU25_12660 [Deltaproteobacteria bacterium]|nr:hypothetical protein [Deltaproteobacteria bacterium]
MKTKTPALPVVATALAAVAVLPYPAWADPLPAPIEALAAAPGSAGVLAAVAGSRVHLTRDRGKRWGAVALAPGIGLREEPSAENEDTEQPEDDAADRNEPVLVWLAVGDSGIWAAARGGEVLVGGPLPGVRRRLKASRVGGLLVDGDDTIWIADEDRVSALDGRKIGAPEVGRWRVPNAGSPAPNLFDRGVLVPGRDGVWSLSIRSGGGPPMCDRARAPARAVAVEPEGGSVWLAAREHLWRRPAGGAWIDMGTTPPGVFGLVVDGDGSPRLRTASGWLERLGGAWRTTTAVAATVDSRGELWTSDGVSVRSLASGPPAVPGLRSADRTDLGTILAAAFARRAEEAGEPPCPTLVATLLPSLGLGAGLGRGLALDESDVPPESARQDRTWFYVGMQASWALDPMPDPSCRKRNEAWRARERRRSENLAALWGAWLRARSSDSADPGTLAGLAAEQRRVEEIIRLESGVTPGRKEAQ